MKKLIIVLLATAFLISCNKLIDFFPKDHINPFNKIYGGSNWDMFTSVVKPQHSNFYFASGFTESNDGDITGNHGGRDIWVVKLNESGNKIWSKAYGGSNEDYAYASVGSLDGGLIIVGYSSSSDGDLIDNKGSSDSWIIKLDKDGKIEWQKNLGGIGQDGAFDIAMTITGDYIIGGFVYSPAENNHQAFILKMDKGGNIIWQKEFGGSEFEKIYTVKIDYDGGILFAGHSFSKNGAFSENKGLDDAWLVKLDKNGNKVWQALLGGSQNDEAYSIVPTRDFGYLVSGATWSSDGDVINTTGGTWIFKLNNKGELKWQKRFNISAGQSSKLYNSPDGNFILSPGLNFILKLDNKGNELWRKNVVAGNVEALIPRLDGTFIAAGAIPINQNVDGFVLTVQ